MNYIPGLETHLGLKFDEPHKTLLEMLSRDITLYLNEIELCIKSKNEICLILDHIFKNFVLGHHFSNLNGLQTRDVQLN